MENEKWLVSKWLKKYKKSMKVFLKNSSEIEFEILEFEIFW